MSGKNSRIRSNRVQIGILVDYMSTHNMLATGEFSGPLGSYRHEAEWQKIKDLLKEHGPDKTIGQWKQTWKDLKRNARHENAAAIRAHSATGNSTDVPIISDVSKKVLDTIGYQSSSGIGPAETLIGLHNNDIEILVEDQAWEAFIPPPEFADENVPPTSNFSEPVHVHVPITSYAPSTSQLGSTSEIPRLSNVKRKAHDTLVHLQEENNNVLKDIRGLLRERNSLLSEQNRISKRQRSTRKFPFSF